MILGGRIDFRPLRLTPGNCDEWGTEVPKERFIEENEEGDRESRLFQGRQESHRRQKCLKARWRISTRIIKSQSSRSPNPTYQNFIKFTKSQIWKFAVPDEETSQQFQIVVFCKVSELENSNQFVGIYRPILSQSTITICTLPSV